MSNLSASKIEHIMKECLGGPEDDSIILAKGLVRDFYFKKEKLIKFSDEIKSFLSMLPDNFQKEKGGGWSFLNACVDKNESQWGEHRDIENLIVLGMALGYVAYCLPRDVWPSLPGGVPYFYIDLKDK